MESDIVTNDISVVREHVVSRSMTHVYSYSHMNLEDELSQSIVKTEDVGLTIVCFRSKARVKEISSKYKDNVLIGAYAGKLNTYSEKITRVLLCSMNKAAELLLDRSIRDKVTYLIVPGWDMYNPHGLLILSLYNYYNMPKCSFVFSSISKYAHIYHKDVDAIGYDNNSISIRYSDDSSVNLLNKLPTPIAYFGQSIGVTRKDVHINPQIGDRGGKYVNVVDTLMDLNGILITKHESVLRTNELNKGTSYRLISKSNYNALKDNKPFEKRLFSYKIALFLIANKLDVTYLPEDHKEAYTYVERMVDGKLSFRMCKIIYHTDLDIISGLFLFKWADRFGQDLRLMYIGCVTSCLISYDPRDLCVGGDLENYNQFVGRNDIETLHKMWSSLMEGTNKVLLQAEGGIDVYVRVKIAKWCVQKGFNVDSVTRLCKTFIEVIGEMINREHINKFIYKYINTRSINTIINVISSIAREAGGDARKFDTKYILPCKVPIIRSNRLIPIRYTHDNELMIYLNNRDELKDVVIAFR